MKNKIVISTLYDSINCGTFLQAYSLGKYLESNNYEVYYLLLKNDNSNIKHYSNKISIKEFIIKAFRKIILKFKFKDVCKIFKTISIDDVNRNKNIKNIIIGSDEIWNILNSSFVHYKEYFGYNFNNKKIIAYAPCSNDTTYNDLNKYYNNEINFKNFDYLSARDKKTEELIKKFDDRKVIQVLDPTFLVDTFNEIIINTNLKNYIIVYGHSFTEDQIEQIKKVSKELHLPLVSITKYFKWCDKNIIATPGEFLSYIKNSNYIITSTFHGSVFSIIFNKQFAVYLNNGSKIYNLLEKFDLKDRIINDSILKILNIKINYNYINIIIKDLKKQSQNYLKKALEDDNNE